MKVAALTPVVSAAPGQVAVARVRVDNDHAEPTSYSLRVLGLGGHDDDVEIDGVLVDIPPGQSGELDVSLPVPAAYASGQHSVAIEVRSQHSDETPVVASLTLSVGSLDRLVVRTFPSNITARRTGRFKVELLNRRTEDVDVHLAGTGPELRVRIKPNRVSLRPNQRTIVKGRARGPRGFFGDPTHHVLTVEARGNSAPAYAVSSLRLSPILPRRLRVGVAAIVVLGLWAGMVGAGAWWWTQRDRDPATDTSAQMVDTDGDGVPGLAPLGPDGQSVPGGGGTGGAGNGTGTGTGTGTESGPPKPQAPTSTVMKGTVKAGDTGQDDGVTVTLTSLTPPAQNNPANPVAQTIASARRTGTSVVSLDGGSLVPAVAGGTSDTAKFWSARYGTYQPAGTFTERRTETVSSITSDLSGLWTFGDVRLRQTYEVSFSKPGYDTQSFAVTPPDDGSEVELDVELQPGVGVVAGTVTGPGGGALGGVDLRLSDGTLVFTSTSSTTAGSVGQWNFGALSTPGTYTLTASLRGYGTEVIQITLGTGEQRSGLSISMRQGVGSIGGTVRADGELLGGATLIATQGDLERSTSSLTEGDSGTYLFPQLPVPSTGAAVYTVVASAPGYISQSREVSLSGNAGGIDFDLTRTTGSIFGLVTSDLVGNLPNAAVEIRRDDLVFRTTSAVSPDAGSFNVADLPPGRYLVSLSRYDHVIDSRLVDVAAGQRLDLGTVQLEYRERPQLAATANLVVRVIDSQTNNLPGATVTLLDVATGNPVRPPITMGPAQSSVDITAIEAGTYDLRVSLSLYRTVQRRVSIGVSERQVAVPLFRLGQASGQIVNPTHLQVGPLKPQTDPFLLGDYRLEILRINSDGSETFQQAVVVPAGAPIVDGKLLWETLPDSLTSGLYRVRVDRAPPGFFVNPNQQIDPRLTPANPGIPGPPTALTFEIPVSDDSIRDLEDIIAVPYPNVGGRIFTPLLTDPVTNEVGMVRLDPATTTVTLICPNGQATATISTDGPTEEHFYRFSRTTLQNQNLLGPCTIRVVPSNPLLQTVEVPLASPLQVSDGQTLSDQSINVALPPVSPSLDGTVFWTDTGTVPATDIPLTGRSINTVGEVLVDFTSPQASNPSANNLATPPQGVPAVGPINLPNVNGVWSMPAHSQQVFGRTVYEFSGGNDFQTGQLSITINQYNRVVEEVSNLTLTEQNGQIHVLLQPLPGQLSGNLLITTVDPAPDFDGIGITANGPGGAGTVIRNDPAHQFRINPAAAGTWQLSMSPPDNHRVTTVPTGTFLPPAGNVSNLNASFVEMGRIDVLVTDSEDNPLEDASVTVTRVPRTDGTPGDPDEAYSQTYASSDTGRATFDQLPVNLNQPTNLYSTYEVSVSIAGFDVSQSHVTLTGGVPGNNINTLSDKVHIRAGQKPALTVKLPRFGEIIGHVKGRLGDAGAPTEPIQVGPPLTLQATRVFTLSGEPVTGGAALPATARPLFPDDFRITGPPGYYRLTVSHPFFAADLVGAPAGAPAPFGYNDFLHGPWPDDVYLIGNDITTDLTDAADAFLLEVLRGTLDLTVVLDRTSAVAAGEVDVKLTRSGFVDIEDTTDVDGLLEIHNIVPGAYTIELRKRSVAGDDVNYPVFATISIPRGSMPEERTIDVLASMPPVGGAIAGTVGAVNVDGFPVRMPDSVLIERSYTPPGLLVDGTDEVDNDADDGDVFPAPTPTATVARSADPDEEGDPQPFVFENLGAGVHELTFDDVTGFTTPSPNPLEVLVDGTSNVATGQIDYVATNVTVEVTVVSSDTGNPVLPDADVVMTKPDGNTQLPVVDPEDPPPPGVFIFEGVQPDLRDYYLTVTEDFHLDLVDNGTTDLRYVLRVNPSGTTVTATVEMSAESSEIEGFARQQDPSPTNVTNMVNVGLVSLYKTTTASNAGGLLVTSVQPGTGGQYKFLVNEVGYYRVEVTRAGYAPRSAMVSTNQVQLNRRVFGPTVTVPKYATLNVTLAGGAATATDKSVTMVAEPAGPVPISPVTVSASPPNNVFTFAEVDPDATYRITVAAGDYVSQQWPTGAAWNPGIGEVRNESITLLRRQIAVDVSVNSGGGNPQRSATVVLCIPANCTATGVYTATQVGTGTGSGSTQRYLFDNVPRDSGVGEATVSIAGYRTQKAAVSASFATNPQAVPVVMWERVRVRGTISGVPVGQANFTVTATPTGGGTPITVTSTGDTATTTRDYDFNNADRFNTGEWTISAAISGVGAGSVVVDIPATTIGGAGLTSQNFALAPRDVTFTFTVTSGSNPVTNASVYFQGRTPVPANATTGLALVTVPENANLNWTMTSPTHLTQTGTATLATLAIPVSTSVRPTVTGTLSVGGTATNGIVVWACPGTPATCDAGTSASSTTSANVGGNDGRFSFVLDVGVYRFGATNAQGNVTTGNIEVSATGAVTGASPNINLNAPGP